MRSGGWLLTAVVLAVAAWLLFLPGKTAPVLTQADLVGCYAGGGARVVLRMDGTMQAGDLEGRYHIAHGSQGVRPQTVLPARVTAHADQGRLRFAPGEGADRWSLAGERGAHLWVVGVRMKRRNC